jgi:hypothetical protein
VKTITIKHILSKYRRPERLHMPQVMKKRNVVTCSSKQKPEPCVLYSKSPFILSANPPLPEKMILVPEDQHLHRHLCPCLHGLSYSFERHNSN